MDISIIIVSYNVKEYIISCIQSIYKHSKSNYSFEFEVAWGLDLQSEHERYLTEKYFRKPVIVMNYHKDIKAFYMKRDPANPKLSLNVDVLAPEGVGEIIGGGQREDDLSVLEQSIAKHDLPREPVEWYLDLRRYGSVPHAGFGLGLERTVAWLCGTEHVRECIPFPRMLYRMYP